MLTVNEVLERMKGSRLAEKAGSKFYVHEFVELDRISHDKYELLQNAYMLAWYRGYMYAKREKKHVLLTGKEKNNDH